MKSEISCVNSKIKIKYLAPQRYEFQLSLPAVYHAARVSKGPPRKQIGATTAPITAHYNNKYLIIHMELFYLIEKLKLAPKCSI